MKVMLVEDEAIIRTGLKKLFENIIGGFTVVSEAENGKKALESVKLSMPDLIVTDIRMPDMGGLELIDRAREQFQHIQFLIISGYSDFEYAKKAIQLGVHDYLLKPIDQVELALCLGKIKKRFGDNSIFEQRSSVDTDKPNAKISGTLIQKVKQIIQSRIEQDLSLRFVADQVYLHPQYLSTLFKSVTGKKYIDYVIELRIDKAKRLLIETNLKVYEIAVLVGYPNIKYFFHTFRQTVGVPPAEYRKQTQRPL
mgnify:CR=1 FL=1